MKKTMKRRPLSAFASHILLCGVILATVFCVGYISNLEHMSYNYVAACEFFILLITEIVCFTCLADYIYKTTK